MTTEKMIAVIEMYEDRLRVTGIPRTRMNPSRTFASLSKQECLQHAFALCEGAKEFARDPERRRKAGSHLAAIQMCLGFAGWYTLQDLMDHNRP